MITRAVAEAFLLCSVFVAGCASSKQSRGEAPELQTLLQFMTGSFSSQAQAAADANFLDIRLHMVRVWPQRTDGYWLYVEQASAEQQQRPYRQRVYHLTQSMDGLLESAVFTIADPIRFAGEWMKPEPLSTLNPDSLIRRDGCSILLRAEGDSFVGSTSGRGCPSELRGAAYATSEVRIVRDTLISWDRGWDPFGNQAWGATHGGYVFVKKRL